MPRPVVPILRAPRKRSVTLSRVRLYGAMRCALADDDEPRGVDAAGLEPVDLLEEHLEVDDDAVADDRA